MKVEKAEWPGAKPRAGHWVEIIRSLNGDVLAIDPEGEYKTEAVRSGLGQAARLRGIKIQTTLRDGVLYIRKVEQP